MQKLTIQLKRGYAITIKSEHSNAPEIVYLGNYSKSDYAATPIVDRGGIAPTVRENHGQVTAIIVYADTHTNTTRRNTGIAGN